MKCKIMLGSLVLLTSASSIAAVSISKPKLTSVVKSSNDEFLKTLYKNQSTLETYKIGMQIQELTHTTKVIWDENNNDVNCPVIEKATQTIVDIDKTHLHLHIKKSIKADSTQNQNCIKLNRDFQEISKDALKGYAIDGFANILDYLHVINLNKAKLDNHDVFNITFAASPMGIDESIVDVIIKTNENTFQSVAFESVSQNGKLESITLRKNNGIVDISNLLESKEISKNDFFIDMGLNQDTLENVKIGQQAIQTIKSSYDVAQNVSCPMSIQNIQTIVDINEGHIKYHVENNTKVDKNSHKLCEALNSKSKKIVLEKRSSHELKNITKRFEGKEITKIEKITKENKIQYVVTVNESTETNELISKLTYDLSRPFFVSQTKGIMRIDNKSTFTSKTNFLEDIDVTELINSDLLVCTKNGDFETCPAK